MTQGQGQVGSDHSPPEVRQGHEATEGGGQSREHRGGAGLRGSQPGCPAATSPPGAVACGHAVSHPGPHPSQRQPVTHLPLGAPSASRRTQGLHGRCRGKHAPFLGIQLDGWGGRCYTAGGRPRPQPADSSCLCSLSSKCRRLQGWGGEGRGWVAEAPGPLEGMGTVALRMGNSRLVWRDTQTGSRCPQGWGRLQIPPTWCLWVSPLSHVPHVPTPCSGPGPGPGPDFWNRLSWPGHPQGNNTSAAGREQSGPGLYPTCSGSLAWSGGRAAWG